MNVDYAKFMPAGYGWFIRLLSSHCQVQVKRVAEKISPWVADIGEEWFSRQFNENQSIPGLQGLVFCLPRRLDFSDQRSHISNAYN